MAAKWSERAELSERLPPGQSGWLGAAAVDSIPALTLSHSQKVNEKLLYQVKWKEENENQPICSYFSLLPELTERSTWY